MVQNFFLSSSYPAWTSKAAQHSPEMMMQIVDCRDDEHQIRSFNMVVIQGSKDDPQPETLAID